MKLKFRNKTYTFVRKHNIQIDAKKLNVVGREGKVQLDGFAEHPSVKNKKIVVDKSLTGEKELEIILHEFQHCCFPDLSEEAIDQASADMAKALYSRLGYRKSE